MTDLKISQLPPTTVINNGDLIPVVQSGTTVKYPVDFAGRPDFDANSLV